MLMAPDYYTARDSGQFLDALLGTSIFGADIAQRIAGTTDVSAYRALGRLTAAAGAYLQIFVKVSE
nr:hypothetical protein [Rhodococcus sp. JVH1]EJJ01676.1 hypothetical protein JVH1_0703 [Rhodococcus sp. JVH1]